MSIATKFGCLLIGWNPNILATCGEASFRQFRKLVSALTIMMILWGTVGYCFANNYLNLTSVLGCLGAALVFMTIVLCIERVIILSVGKNFWMPLMRVFLALCMAIIGASIFDQLMFRNDIQQEIASHRQDLISEMVKKRLAIYDADIAKISKAQDSIRRYNEELYKQIQAEPVIVITTVDTSEQIDGYDDEGKPKKTTLKNVNNNPIQNPLIAQAEGNKDQLLIYEEQLKELRLEKRDIEKNTRDEINARPTGFIEELEATYRVISQSSISLAFYMVVFLFLLFLELFVLTIKAGEKSCDYELIVEHQLSHKKNLLNDTEDSLRI